MPKPITFYRDLTEEALCHEGQIPWETPASLGPRASCPSFCSSHTQGWAFASDHPRLHMLLILRCGQQCSLVKRHTQPTSLDSLTGLDRAWEENEESTQPGTLVPSAQGSGLQRFLCSCISSPLGPFPVTGQDKEPGVGEAHPAPAGLHQKRSLKSHRAGQPALGQGGPPGPRCS